MWGYGVLAAIATITAVSGSASDQYEAPYYSHSNGGGFYGDADGGYMSMDWGAGGLQQQKCIDIPQNMSLCKDIGYHKMRIPNLLDHDTVREVTQQASSWVPLLGIRCHPDTKLFLCSLFSPVCLDRPIWPCRTLCESVKDGCETLMLKYGFPWPEMLRCDKFPADNDLCIGLQHDNQPDDSVCTACNLPITYEAIVDNFCSADYVLRITINDQIISGDDLKLNVHKKTKKLKKGSLKKRDTRDMQLMITGGATCECPYFSQSTQQGNKRDKTKYLVMGGREGDKLVLQYLAPMDMHNPGFKKAWKAMNKGDLCQNGLPSLPNEVKEKPKRKRKDRGNGNAAAGNTEVVNNGDTPNTDMKRRKNCKNPKKCVSTGGSPSTSTRRHSGADRNNRRGTKKGRRQNQE